MVVEKLSVSVPEDVAELIRSSASAAGLTVSAWVAEAARGQAALETSRLDAITAAEGLVVEYQSAHGPIPPEVWSEVDAFVDQVEKAQTAAPEHQGGSEPAESPPARVGGRRAG